MTIFIIIMIIILLIYIVNQISREKAKEWYNKGIALLEAGRIEEAIKCFDSALDIDPGYAEAWVGKGLVLVILGRYEEALNCAEEALKINPNLSLASGLKKICLEKLLGK